MERLRTPFQGVSNIIRFNWHFYILAFGSIIVLMLVHHWLGHPFPVLLKGLVFLILATLLLSLLVSYYIYDRSGLYELKWLERLGLKEDGRMLNIHAGFDETSVLLQAKFPAADLQVYDFYDPEKHTEVSIERARKVYPAYPNTIQLDTVAPALSANYADAIFLILAAHEIRDDAERIQFFKALKHSLTPQGKIVVVEHLRDWPNFLAYTIGYFHFLSRSSWDKTFESADLSVDRTFKITPFLTLFTLR